MTVHAAPWVLPISAPPIADGAVALDRAGQVVAVGRAAELSRLGAVEHHDGVLLPGLVNAHTHVELSHLAGRVPGGDGLVPWIRRLMAERVSDEAARQEAARPAIAALAARGTVCVGDVNNGTPVAPLLRDAGVDVVTFDERIQPRGLPAPPRRGAIPTAHATYTCGKDALVALAAHTGGRIASIHVEEDPAEAAWLSGGDGPLRELLTERGALPDAGPPGLAPVAWLEALGVLGPGTLLVHLTCAGDDALAAAARAGAVAVLCPRSNLYIGGRLPPWRRIRAAGLRVALGTDSLASAPSLDVLGDVAALARDGADPAWLLACATSGGATALGRPHLGALAVGLRPGLVCLGSGARSIDDPVAWVAHEGAQAPARRLA